MRARTGNAFMSMSASLRNRRSLITGKTERAREASRSRETIRGTNHKAEGNNNAEAAKIEVLAGWTKIHLRAMAKSIFMMTIYHFKEIGV
jgi:hypothetical protein